MLTIFNKRIRKDYILPVYEIVTHDTHRYSLVLTLHT